MSPRPPPVSHTLGEGGGEGFFFSPHQGVGSACRKRVSFLLLSLVTQSAAAARRMKTGKMWGGTRGGGPAVLDLGSEFYPPPPERNSSPDSLCDLHVSLESVFAFLTFSSCRLVCLFSSRFLKVDRFWSRIWSGSGAADSRWTLVFLFKLVQFQWNFLLSFTRPLCFKFFFSYFKRR